MNTCLDIPYFLSDTSSPFHKFDLYLPIGSQLSTATDESPPLICMVHGGAWRSQDKADHAILAHKIAAYTRSPVAVPNYRLSTADNHLYHPEHAADILQFLEFVQQWSGPHSNERLPYDPERIYLIGHSCSAHMLSSIFLHSKLPQLSPTPRLLNAVQAFILSEGVYDVDILLSSFPTYHEWFIDAAFGKRASYQDVSVFAMNQRSPSFRWLIIHSEGDTLVDILQSGGMYDHLSKQYEHLQLDPSSYVTKNFNQLNEEHDAILMGNDYVNIVGTFILQDASRSTDA